MRSTVAPNLTPDFTDGFECMKEAILADTRIAEHIKTPYKDCYLIQSRDMWQRIYSQLHDDKDYDSIGGDDEVNAMIAVRNYMRLKWPGKYEDCNPEFNKQADLLADEEDSRRIDKEQRTSDEEQQTASKLAAEIDQATYEKRKADSKAQKASNAAYRDALRNPLSDESTARWRASQREVSNASRKSSRRTNTNTLR